MGSAWGQCIQALSQQIFQGGGGGGVESDHTGPHTYTRAREWLDRVEMDFGGFFTAFTESVYHMRTFCVKKLHPCFVRLALQCLLLPRVHNRYVLLLLHVHRLLALNPDSPIDDTPHAADKPCYYCGTIVIRFRPVLELHSK